MLNRHNTRNMRHLRCHMHNHRRHTDMHKHGRHNHMHNHGHRYDMHNHGHHMMNKLSFIMSMIMVNRGHGHDLITQLCFIGMFSKRKLIVMDMKRETLEHHGMSGISHVSNMGMI